MVRWNCCNPDAIYTEPNGLESIGPCIKKNIPEEHECPKCGHIMCSNCEKIIGYHVKG